MAFAIATSCFRRSPSLSPHTDKMNRARRPDRILFCCYFYYGRHFPSPLQKPCPSRESPMVCAAPSWLARDLRGHFVAETATTEARRRAFREFVLPSSFGAPPGPFISLAPAAMQPLAPSWIEEGPFEAVILCPPRCRLGHEPCGGPFGQPRCRKRRARPPRPTSAPAACTSRE